MNTNISMAVTFIAGVAIGALASYKIAETKYKNIADEEIQSVIDRFSNREPVPVDEDKNEDDTVEETDRFSEKKNNIREYKNTVDRIGYDKVSKQNEKPKRGRKKKDEVEQEVAVAREDNSHIYVISPDDYNTLGGYTTETLYYSSDNYVLDSNCKVMSDSCIANTIGHDPYGHFGEYEDDAVHVRNDELMRDYEILLSMKTRDEIQEG